MLRIYVIGLIILIVAIIANLIISNLDIISWYNFINLISENGISAFKRLSFLDYLWLFVAYPILLGLGFWIGDSAYKKIKKG